jgi:hypothetical protein
MPSYGYGRVSAQQSESRPFSPIRSDPSSCQRPALPPLPRLLSRRPTLPRAAAPRLAEGRDRTADSPRRAHPDRIGGSGHPGSAGRLSTTSCDHFLGSFRPQRLDWVGPGGPKGGIASEEEPDQDRHSRCDETVSASSSTTRILLASRIVPSDLPMSSTGGWRGARSGAGSPSNLGEELPILRSYPSSEPALAPATALLRRLHRKRRPA